MRRDAIESIRDDHARVLELLTRLAATTDRSATTRQKLVAQVEKELTIHARLEEEVLYPAFLEAARTSEDRQLFFRSTEEHHIVEIYAAGLKGDFEGVEQFLAKVTVLRQLIEHHAIEEEERTLLPRARGLLSEEEMSDLTTRLNQRRLQLISRWENPITRPVKKVQSLVEKVLPAAVKTAKAAKAGVLRMHGRSRTSGRSR